MVKFAVRSYLINLFALWVTAQYIGGFQLSDGLRSLLIVGGGFTVLHLLLKPILNLFLGALNFLTLGFIDLFIDAGILYLITIYFPQISITGWFFPGLETSFLMIPAYEFNVILTTIISAFLINVIRSGLSALSE